MSGLSDMDDFILDVSWKSMVELVSESGFAPFTLDGKPDEVNHVLHDVLVFLEMEALEFSLSISDGVVQSEVHSELVHKYDPTGKPGQLHDTGEE